MLKPKRKKKKSLSLVYYEEKANRELGLNKDGKLWEKRFKFVDNYTDSKSMNQSLRQINLPLLHTFRSSLVSSKHFTKVKEKTPLHSEGTTFIQTEQR